ncbi:FHA domain-containing protein [Paenibacillus sp. NPDC057886]|uniref:FHA domain-containing protein n=1 Tax=Paenibacillus sp. NPDC057886 TaxID=3346270 RepID=UPI0036A936F5
MPVQAEVMEVKRGRSVLTMGLDACVAMISLAVLYYIFIINRDMSAQWITGIIVVLSGGAYLYFKYMPATKAEKKKLSSRVVKLVLLDDDGTSVKEWYIQGETSVLIGKSSKNSEADIDLSDTPYASLISSQHAVLNKASGQWFIEDIDSASGVGVRKGNQSRASKLEIEEPSLIEAGDLIYIANTRILVK